jgi:hypothetical protein
MIRAPPCKNRVIKVIIRSLEPTVAILFAQFKQGSQPLMEVERPAAQVTLLIMYFSRLRMYSFPGISISFSLGHNFEINPQYLI